MEGNVRIDELITLVMDAEHDPTIEKARVEAAWEELATLGVVVKLKPNETFSKEEPGCRYHNFSLLQRMNEDVYDKMLEEVS